MDNRCEYCAGAAHDTPAVPVSRACEGRRRTRPPPGGPSQRPYRRPWDVVTVNVADWVAGLARVGGADVPNGPPQARATRYCVAKVTTALMRNARAAASRKWIGKPRTTRSLAPLHRHWQPRSKPLYGEIAATRKHQLHHATFAAVAACFTLAERHRAPSRALQPRSARTQVATAGAAGSLGPKNTLRPAAPFCGRPASACGPGRKGCSTESGPRGPRARARAKLANAARPFGTTSQAVPAAFARRPLLEPGVSA